MWLDGDVELEIRFLVASQLRPTGFEDYYFGLDEAFVNRVDLEWRRLYHILNRPMMQQKVAVTNL